MERLKVRRRFRSGVLNNELDPNQRRVLAELQEYIKGKGFGVRTTGMVGINTKKIVKCKRKPTILLPVECTELKLTLLFYQANV